MLKKLAYMKVPIRIFLLFAVLMTVLGIFIYRSTAIIMRKQMGSQCLGVAVAVTALIEQDVEGYLDFTNNLDTDGEYYRNIKKRLEEIRYANDDNIRFLYTERRISDDEMMYVLDGEKPDDILYSPPGSTDLLTVTRRYAYENQTAYIGESFTENAYGRLLSAYAPIRDRQGQFIGLVGVDVAAEQYDEVMWNLLYIIAGSLVILTLMMAVLSRMLNRMHQDKLRADQESLSKSTFLARMSHEIRTPMNAIVGMNELMLREHLSVPVREQAVSIRQASANLLALINDILDFSKIESGKMELVEAPYLFSSLINDVISIIRMRLLDKPVMLVANIDSRIPNQLIGDEVRLEQILLNVLSNAVKYTNEGYIFLSVSGEVAEEHRLVLSIQVADQGIGIKEKDLKMIFGDFTQVDMMKNKYVEGTGLGLAITRSLCLAMGGTIEVSSRYGEGSTFTITLSQRFEEHVRLAEVNEPESKAVLVYESREAYADSIRRTIADLDVRCVLVTSHSMFLEELGSSTYSHVFVSSFLYGSAKRILQRMDLNVILILLMEYGETLTDSSAYSVAMPVHSIAVANILNGVYDVMDYNESKDSSVRFIAPDARVLIVDDVNTNLKVAEGLLSPFRMQIDCAASGREAIELAGRNRYDLILMDHMMPEMDGIEATARIRELETADGYCRNVPIAALTANAVFGIREMFLQNGMNDFLAKPIETAKLYSLIETWIPKEKQLKVTDKSLPASIPESEIAGVDLNAGIAMTGGNPENYRHILAVFQKDGILKSEQIRASLEHDDIALFTIYVHALKSASASVGALDLAEQAKRLEYAGRKEDLEFVRSNIDPFLQELDSLTVSISEYLQTVNADTAFPDPEDKEAVAVQLTELKKALAVIDIEATDQALAKLQQMNVNDPLQHKLSQLYQLVLLFDYEEATGMIDVLLAEEEM